MAETGCWDMTDILNEKLRNVCRIGQGHDCCRYLIASGRGLECAKLTPLKTMLDSRGDTMTAQGDNCEGVEGVIA